MLRYQKLVFLTALLVLSTLLLYTQFARAQEVLPTITPKPMPAGILPPGFLAVAPADLQEIAAIEEALPAMAEEALGLLNSARVRAGCAPLLSHSLLYAVALEHSRDMAQNNYFSHTSLDGKGPGTRASEAGYPWGRYAENIAAGYSTAQGVVDGWLASEGHRRNVLNCDYKEGGLAVFYDPSSTYLYYWTHDMAERRAGAEPPTATATPRPTQGATPTPLPTSTPAPPSGPPDFEIPTDYQVRLPIVIGR